MDLFKKRVPSKDYLYIKDILKKWLDRDDTKAIVSSVMEDNSCHITNHDKTINITLRGNRVDISNHRYHIEKVFPLKDVEELVKMVNERVKSDVESFKQEVKNNEENLLREIFNFE